MIRRLAELLARRLGMELHYPEQATPDPERAGTRANDGSPCSPWPAEPERYESRKAEGRRGEYR